eukprot:12409746-Karenia_brevis.AAC.1
MLDRVEGVGDLDFAADFADDGVTGSDVDDVLKVLQAEVAIGHDYGLRNNYSKMVLYPLAGQGFTGDVSVFEHM